MTELMANEKGERIYDRSREHLGSLDIMVITVRRQLLKAVKAHMNGVLPPNVDDVALDRVRPATVVLPLGADWAKETEKIRDGDGGEPVAWEIKPLRYLTPAEPIEAVGGSGG
jgi:hypothetical protein